MLGMDRMSDESKQSPLSADVEGALLESMHGRVASFSGSFAINPEHFRMRAVICEQCDLHIGSFNLHTFAGREDEMEKRMRDLHNEQAHKP